MRGPVLMVGAVATLSALVVAGSSGVASADGGVSLPTVSPLPTISVSVPPLPLPTVTVSVPPAPVPAPTASAPGGGGGSGPGGGTSPGGGAGGGSGTGSGPAAGGSSGRAGGGAAGDGSRSTVRPMIAGRPEAQALLDTETTPALARASRAFLAADLRIAALTRARTALDAARVGASRAAQRYRQLQVDATTAGAEADTLQTRSDQLHSTLVGDARRAYQTGRSTSDDASVREIAATYHRLDEAATRAQMWHGSLVAEQIRTKAEYDRYAADFARAQRSLSGLDQRLQVLAERRAAALAAARAARGGELARNRATLAESGRLGAQIRAASARLAAAGRTVPGTGHFTRPSTGVVTSPFGQRYHPILHYVKLHTGTDFSVGDGFAHAADRGRVLFTIVSRAYGNFTIIDHGVIDGRHITTAYAHQARFLVRPGQVVAKGQRIGVIGQTGYATGPHLHFEVRDNGAVADPMAWLS